MRLAKEALELENLEVRLEDVRALDPQRHGAFDVVLCLGLLYHLDAPPTSSGCLNACGTSAVTSSSLRPASHLPE
jgi:2-polyprenyl-3-methyl-5-hydroxy-6-metoxy-1,4-benzoquinol methylase